MALNSVPIICKPCCQGGLTVTLSSSEAEYVAARAAAQENIYLRSLLAGFQVVVFAPNMGLLLCGRITLRVFL